MATTSSPRNGQKLPTDRLRDEVQNLLGAVGDRAVKSVRDKVGGVTGRLTDFAEDKGGSSLVGAITGVKDIAEGKSPTRALLGAGTATVKDKIKNMFGGGGKGKGGKKLKVTSIVESIDVGVPVHVAYNQWTQFSDFPAFMKKVESVEQQSEEKLRWKAQIFWSHRSWESTITSQVPDDHIVWRSKGDKGYVDGAVTFHELAPNLTRILLVLEYHPQGLFEHTGNLWRAQGRRARLELKHFRRHVMSDVITHPDDIEGWRGVIEDGEVVQDHEPASEEEPAEGGPEDREDEEGPEDREDREGPEDEEGPEDRERAEVGTPEDEQPEEDEETGGRSRRGRTRSSNGERRASSREPSPARRRTTRTTTRRSAS
jgi:uncharacterized membrane protein